jgi:hypothetical protein
VIPNAIQLETANHGSIFLQSFLNRNSAYRCFRLLSADARAGRVPIVSELEQLALSAWRPSENVGSGDDDDGRSETSSVFSPSTSTSPPRDDNTLVLSSPQPGVPGGDDAAVEDPASARRRKTAPPEAVFFDPDPDGVPNSRDGDSGSDGGGGDDVDAKAAAAAIARPLVNAARVISRGASLGSSANSNSPKPTTSAAAAGGAGKAATTETKRGRKGSTDASAFGAAAAAPAPRSGSGSRRRRGTSSTRVVGADIAADAEKLPGYVLHDAVYSAGACVVPAASLFPLTSLSPVCRLIAQSDGLFSPSIVRITLLPYDENMTHMKCIRIALVCGQGLTRPSSACGLCSLLEQILSRWQRASLVTTSSARRRFWVERLNGAAQQT